MDGKGNTCARTRFEEGSSENTGDHFSDLDASDSHHCVLKREKGASDLYCWGMNDFGQLGTGNRDYQWSPQKVLGLGKVDESGWKCWGNAARRQFDAVPWVAAPTTLMLPWQ